MMSSQQEQPSPDVAAIRRWIERVSCHWEDLGDRPCAMAFRFIAENRTTQNTLFDVRDSFFLEEAVAHVAAMTEAGMNAYACVNPVDPTNIAAGRAAADKDVLAAFFNWIDCDDAVSAEAARNFAGPKYAFAVITGRTPHTRPHLYWELAERVEDMAEWRSQQIAMAARFQSDGAVINPSRIMRIAGTISAPDAKKRARGYIPEVAEIREDKGGPPVPFGRLRALFPDGPQHAPGSSPQAQGGGFTLDAGAHEASLDRALAAANIEAGEEWHNNIIRLVASYVSRGLSDPEIHAITDSFTQSGYTVDQTRVEVQKAINGAREKGWAREQAAEPGFGGEPADVEKNRTTESAAQKADDDKADEEPQPIPFTPWKPFDLTTIPRIQFVYSDFYARGYTSLTIAPPKVGKSMLGLAEAIDMATGQGFLTGVEREPQRVVYFNAEDDQNVINNRVAALLTRYGVDQSEIEGRLYAQSGVDWSNFYFAAGDEGVICEKVFKMLEAFIAKERADVLIFDPLQDISDAPESNDVFRRIGRRLRKMAATHNVAIGIIHHTRKIAPGVEISMEDARGGSALRGTARFNRALSPMSDSEGAKAGISNYRHFLRIGDIESNLAPPSSDMNRWFQKISVECPNGEWIGAVEPWVWPDAFAGVTREHAKRVRDLLDRRQEPPKWHFNSRDWVGLMVADVIGMSSSSSSDRARIKTILAKWAETEIIEIVEIRDPEKGRDVKVVLAGKSDPMEENKS